MIHSLHCQELTKPALSTVSEGEPSSTLLAALVSSNPGFFYAVTANLAPIVTAPSGVGTNVPMERSGTVKSGF